MSTTRLLDLASRMLAVLHREREPEMEIVGVEQPFDVPLIEQIGSGAPEARGAVRACRAPARSEARRADGRGRDAPAGAERRAARRGPAVARDDHGGGNERGTANRGVTRSCSTTTTPPIEAGPRPDAGARQDRAVCQWPGVRRGGLVCSGDRRGARFSPPRRSAELGDRQPRSGAAQRPGSRRVRNRHLHSAPVRSGQEQPQHPYEVNNRGRKFLMHWVDDAPATTPASNNDSKSPSEAGNGWLLRQGYSLAWSGWDPDAPTRDSGLSIRLPTAVRGGEAIVQRIRDEIVVGTRGPVDVVQARLTYPVASLDQSRARLTMRSYEREARVDRPGDRWLSRLTAWREARIVSARSAGRPTRSCRKKEAAMGHDRGTVLAGSASVSRRSVLSGSVTFLGSTLLPQVRA